MLAALTHLLAASEKSAAEEGRDVVLSMLVVGLIFVAIAVGGDLLARSARRTRPGIAGGRMIRAACGPSYRPARSRSSSPTWRGRRGCCTSSARRRTPRRSQSTGGVIREACAPRAASRSTRRATPSSSRSRPLPGALLRPRASTNALASGPIQRPGRRPHRDAAPHRRGLRRRRRPPRSAHRRRRSRRAGARGRVDAPRSSSVELLDLGEHRFKDLATPERVFQLGDARLPAAQEPRTARTCRCRRTRSSGGRRSSSRCCGSCSGSMRGS